MKYIYVGSRQIIIKDKNHDLTFNILLHYPTHQLPISIKFGPYEMEVSVDAAIIGQQFPLVLISHGNGGSHLVYRTISMYLAQHGYIVAMVEHYGNNRNNNELENTIKNLIYRPRHISLTIDALLNDEKFKQNINPNKIAVVGHSMGGYTALALAGGIPWMKEGHKVEVNSDTRIKAAVLMAPGTGWFLNSLDRVSIPIFLLAAEKDDITPAWNTDIILNSIPDKTLIKFSLIENAGHFSFISPFPDAMNSPTFAPSTDPPGFDRKAFHKKLPKDIFDFLNNNLK